MNNQKLICAGLLAIAVITIVVLVILLVKYHNRDNYQHQHNNCGTCQGLGEKVCVDRPKLHELYGDGILTETSNLMRGKQWPVTMPYDQWAATNESFASMKENSFDETAAEAAPSRSAPLSSPRERATGGDPGCTKDCTDGYIGCCEKQWRACNPPPDGDCKTCTKLNSCSAIKGCTTQEGTNNCVPFPKGSDVRPRCPFTPQWCSKTQTRRCEFWPAVCPEGSTFLKKPKPSCYSEVAAVGGSCPSDSVEIDDKCYHAEVGTCEADAKLNPKTNLCENIPYPPTMFSGPVCPENFLFNYDCYINQSDLTSLPTGWWAKIGSNKNQATLTSGLTTYSISGTCNDFYPKWTKDINVKQEPIQYYYDSTSDPGTLTCITTQNDDWIKTAVLTCSGTTCCPQSTSTGSGSGSNGIIPAGQIDPKTGKPIYVKGMVRPSDITKPQCINNMEIPDPMEKCLDKRSDDTKAWGPTCYENDDSFNVCKEVSWPVVLNGGHFCKHAPNLTRKGDDGYVCASLYCNSDKDCDFADPLRQAPDLGLDKNCCINNICKNCPPPPPPSPPKN